MTEPDRPRFVDRPTLSKLFSIPVPTLETWACRGGGPPVTRVGRKVLYDLELVEAWLRECTEHPRAAAG